MSIDWENLVLGDYIRHKNGNVYQYLLTNMYPNNDMVKVLKGVDNTVYTMRKADFIRKVEDDKA